ncbi:MAG: patatin-like phospholipase family protein [Actinomycetota bacterium]|nr:patatin-like phospholipase family protein [Actinomycetota bacterium]
MLPTEIAELPRPLAFVLPGGGALGAYQVGVLKALAEAGVTPDLMVGVSAGAVNAALYTWNHGADGAHRMEAVWRGIRRRDLLRLHPGRLAMAFAGRHPSFLDNRHGHAFLRRNFGHRLVEDAPIRLALVATDLSTGEAVALTSGSVATAVLASTAFPGVYPPVAIDGRMLIDGGVVADIPLEITAALGARSALVLAVPPLATVGDPPTRAIEILFRASTLGVEAHGRTILRRPPPGLMVAEISAPPSSLTTFDVGRSAGVIDIGYAAAAEWLATAGTARSATESAPSS